VKNVTTNLKLEELLNTFSHLFGVILALIGFWFLRDADSGKTVWSQTGIWVYSFSLFLLFSISTFYHAVVHPKWKRRFRILDHISIYVLIAGTYTPVALITLWQGNGTTILYIVWGMAFLGTFFKLFYTGKFEFLSLLLYLVMGWLIVLDFNNLLQHTTKLGIELLMLGGFFYTVGIFFYAWRRIPYNHFIWHIFVLGGAISHWFFIYLDVV
jgi:hemolysin III